MKNKKGFTLVELLAVITIMAIMALFAVPNIINMLEKGKKEQNITDAKEMISKAKYKFKLSDIELENNEEFSYELNDLGYSNYKDGYGDYYANTSYVKVVLSNYKYIYSVYLSSNNHCLSNDDTNCEEVLESALDISKVIEKES